jgi:hypothetical protein
MPEVAHTRQRFAEEIPTQWLLPMYHQKRSGYVYPLMQGRDNLRILLQVSNLSRRTCPLLTRISDFTSPCPIVTI